MRKKNITKQAVRSAAAQAAKEEVKAAPAVEEVKVEDAKVEETKAEEVKTEEVKAEAEVVEEKAAEKKAAAKKTTKKAAEKKDEMKPEVYIQFNGQEAVLADVIEKAKKQFVEEGHRAGTIKSLQVYLKPEEYAAYYVINQKHAGRVDLF